MTNLFTNHLVVKHIITYIRPSVRRVGFCRFHKIKWIATWNSHQQPTQFNHRWIIVWEDFSNLFHSILELGKKIHMFMIHIMPLQNICGFGLIYEKQGVYFSLDLKGNPNLVEAKTRKIKPTMMFNVPCKRKSGMLDQLITNKDNFIIITCTKYWPKIRKNKQEPNYKFKRQVKNESCKRCYGYNGKKDHINGEGWLIFKYNKLISLSNHFNGNTISKKHGSPCVLTK